MVINKLKTLFLIIGTVFLCIYAFGENGKHTQEWGLLGIFLVFTVVFYPYTIEKIILRIKRKKFVKNLAFMDGAYVLDLELGEFNYLMQKLNRSQKKMKVVFSLIIISILSTLVIYIQWYFYKLESQNLPIQVFYEKFTTVVSYIICLMLFIIVGILLIFLHKNKGIKSKVNEFYSHKDIISKIVKKVNSGFIYTNKESPEKYKELIGDKHIPYTQIETLYKSAGWHKHYDKIYIDNCILGKTNKNQIFKFANILTFRQIKSKTVGYYIIKRFKGLFICVEKNNTIYSGIKIKRKGLNNSLWNKFLEKSDEKLYYEFKELLKYYTISAKNIDFVNNHISDRLVDYLLEVKNEFPFEFEIIFDDENTYLRVFTGEMFTPKTMKEKNLEYYYSLIKYTTEMIDNLSNLIK